MSNYVNAIAIIFVLIAGTACSGKDDVASDVEASIDEVSEKMDSMTEAAPEIATGVIERASNPEHVDMGEAPGAIADVESMETPDMDAMSKDLDISEMEKQLGDITDATEGVTGDMADGALERAQEEADKLKEDTMNKVNRGN